MSHDSPSPEYYEPEDIDDEPEDIDDEPEDDEPHPAAEMFVVSHGIVWWHAA